MQRGQGIWWRRNGDTGFYIEREWTGTWVAVLGAGPPVAEELDNRTAADGFGKQSIHVLLIHRLWHQVLGGVCG